MRIYNAVEFLIAELNLYQTVYVMEGKYSGKFRSHSKISVLTNYEIGLCFLAVGINKELNSLQNLLKVTI
jgi:hypothetical protein